MRKIILIFVLTVFSQWAQASLKNVHHRKGLQCNFDQNPYTLTYSISKNSLDKNIFEVNSIPNLNPFSLSKAIFINGTEPIILLQKGDLKHHFPRVINNEKWSYISKLDPAKREQCGTTDNNIPSPQPKWVCSQPYTPKGAKELTRPRFFASSVSFNIPSKEKLEKLIKKPSDKYELPTKKITHYLYQDKVHTVEITAHASKNPNYLTKFKCYGNAKVSTCGENCLKYARNEKSEYMLEHYEDSDFYRLNLKAESLQAVIEFKLQLYKDRHEDFTFDEGALVAALEKSLEAQKDNSKNGIMFFALSSISDSLATVTKQSPTEIKLILY